MKSFETANNPPQEEESSFNPEQSELVDKAVEDISRGNFDILKAIDSNLHKEIALKLFELGKSSFVAEFLDKFQDLDHKAIALKLIEAGEGDSVAEFLEKFQDLNQVIALKLIEAGNGDTVAWNLDKFQGLDHKAIALKLIEAEDGYYVAANLDKFQGLDHKEIVLKLIEVGKGMSVVNYLDKFQGLDHQEIAIKLIEVGEGDLVAESLDKFQGLDQEIAFRLIESGYLQQVLNNLEDSFLDTQEDNFFLKAYKSELGLPSKDIYDKYLELKQAGDEIQLVGYIEKIKDQVDTLISSKEQDENITEQENYKELVELVYPNHVGAWTDFDSNEACPDRSSDLERFKIKDVYEIDLSDGVEMELRDREEKNEKNIEYLEQSITSIQKKFSEVSFEKDKMLGILDNILDKHIENLPNKEIFKTREEKVYALLLESLVDKFDAQELKEVLIGYQFAEFEDIKTYLEGTRGRAGEAKNPDYAYLLELREFFADHVKEVERKISTEAQSNSDIAALLPAYYSQKTDLENSNTKQDDINKLRLDQLGLNGNILERIMKELSRQTDKKGNPFELAELDENNELKAGKKGKTIAGMIISEQKKVAKAIKTLTGKELDPKSIHLGELNLEEYLRASSEIQEGQYDEELFSRYLVQAFQGVFEKELSIIDKEIAKYQPEDEKQKEKQRRKLECFITKNHTSAHARGVGGVCVAGDNPYNGEESQWNLENYFQMVLRDKETMICQGLILLHYYEDNGKKILTASFNPANTYLYKVNETQLFNSLLDQLTEFAEDNDIDTIAVNQNKGIRTNRTGGEFEGAMNKTIRKEDQEVNLSETEDFSFTPEYKQKDLDVIWQRE